MNEKTAYFKTECEKCIFLDENQKCKMNRLDKFITKYGIDVIKNNTALPIIPTWCNTFRLKETNIYSEELKSQTLKECQIQTDVIVISYEETGNIIRNVARSLESSYNQNPKPNRGIICIKNNTIKYGDLYRNLCNAFDVPLSIIRILDDDMNIHYCIDEAVRRCNSTYYIICESGKQIKPNYISELNKMVNEDMIMFSSIINKDENILHETVIQTQLHKLIGGNREKSVIQKIRELSRQQNTPEMVIEK